MEVIELFSADASRPTSPQVEMDMPQIPWVTVGTNGISAAIVKLKAEVHVLNFLFTEVLKSCAES